VLVHAFNWKKMSLCAALAYPDFADSDRRRNFSRRKFLIHREAIRQNRAKPAVVQTQPLPNADGAVILAG
jgi:hypothetical protein